MNEFLAVGGPLYWISLAGMFLCLLWGFRNSIKVERECRRKAKEAEEKRIQLREDQINNLS